MIQIDGTARSNCGAGLQEQVTVSAIEHSQAVAVVSPLWGRRAGHHRADRMLEDLLGAPVVTGASSACRRSPRR
jgi:hypothetical protein